MCSLMINGRPHGGQRGTTTCQLHMRRFKNGDEIWIEPWRAHAFPVIISEHMPQMPSRQSWSNAIGSSPFAISCSFRMSSISRNDAWLDTLVTL